MKLKLTPALLGLGLLFGCVPSVNPLYTEKDVVFDPALMGAWSGDNNKETWAFEKSGDKAYKLLQTDEDGRTAEFEVHLVRLKEHRFLDLYLVDPGMEKDSKMNSYAGFALIPGHMFMKVTQIQPTLQIAFLDPDWLKELLEKNPRAIAHKKIPGNSGDKTEDRIVLTAETEDLQKFILKHINDEKIFGEPGELRRKTNTEPAQPAKN